jgi:hypothetical protein
MPAHPLQAIDDTAAQLELSRLRSHSLRHGCVLNLKRQKVAAADGAAHVCMSTYMWENVYGLEDGEVVGEELTPGIVGSSSRKRRAGEAV